MKQNLFLGPELFLLLAATMLWMSVGNVLGDPPSGGAGPNLVQNGDFALGSFADWTLSGNTSDCLVTSNALFVYDGQYGAELGPVGTPGHLSQTLPTTAGELYTISCWLWCNGAVTNEFSVSWNGAPLFDQENIGATLWTNLQFMVTATNAGSVLGFGFRDDPSFLGLDDIEVHLVPPPQFQGVSLANGMVSLGWTALAGLQYQVQYNTNLDQNAWFNLTNFSPANSSWITTTDSMTASPMRYYRIVRTP